MSTTSKLPRDLGAIIKACINTIVPKISKQQIGLVHQLPEGESQTARCFENVSRKVNSSGGRTQYGWTFHHRFVEAIPGPGYLYITHHAVWNAPDGRLLDVSPYPDPKHRPLSEGNSTIFLVDDKATPVQTESLVAPRPLQFFALSNDQQLVTYVNQLNFKEQERCIEIYKGNLHS